MASGFVSTTTGLLKSFGRLIGTSAKAGTKAMDRLSDRLGQYTDKEASGKDTPPITPNDD
jgi:hypothetical protein